MAGEREQADRMLRAAATGAEAVERQSARGIQESQEGQQFFARMGEAAGQSMQRFEETKAQQTLEGEKLDLEAATRGFQRKKDRPTQVKDEMAKGASQPPIGPLQDPELDRLRRQGEKPLEQQGNSTWEPSEQGLREQTLREFEADTKRMQAMAYEQQVAATAQKNLIAGDMEAYEENREFLLAAPIASQDRLNRLIGKDPEDDDWSSLAEDANDLAQANPQLLKDIENKNFSEEVKRFARSRVAFDSMKYIIGSGGSTKGLDKIDPTIPQIRQFRENIGYWADQLAANPSMVAQMRIRTMADKIRAVNVLAAGKTAQDIIMGIGMASGRRLPPATSAEQQGQQETPSDYEQLASPEQMASKRQSDQAIRSGQLKPLR